MDRPPFTPPHVVGKYELQRMIGYGSFAFVYQASSLQNEIQFAVKVIPKVRIRRIGDQQRLQRELDTLAYINHENIVQLHDFFEDTDYFYLVMDYCEGGSLSDLILGNAKVKLREDQAATIFYQIVTAVAYCHSMGISHRDLKPHNVLITKLPVVKVADFGLCGYIKEDIKMKTICGSPCYTAPECLCGQQYDGRMSDVWSLGVILFELIVGNHPWNTANSAIMNKQISQAKYVLPRDITQACDDLIRTLLKVKPTDRITCQQILEHPWMKLASNKFRKRSILPPLKSNDTKSPEYVLQDRNVDNFNHGVVSPFSQNLGAILKMRKRSGSLVASQAPQVAGPTSDIYIKAKKYRNIPMKHNSFLEGKYKK